MCSRASISLPKQRPQPNQVIFRCIFVWVQKRRFFVVIVAFFIVTNSAFQCEIFVIEPIFWKLIFRFSVFYVALVHMGNFTLAICAFFSSFLDDLSFHFLMSIAVAYNLGNILIRFFSLLSVLCTHSKTRERLRGRNGCKPNHCSSQSKASGRNSDNPRRFSSSRSSTSSSSVNVWSLNLPRISRMELSTQSADVESKPSTSRKIFIGCSRFIDLI